MRKAIIMPLMFFLFCSFVFAESSYPYPGGLNYDFSQGGSQFDDFLTDYSDFLRNVPDAKYQPLVDDLDFDNHSDILVLDNYTFKIFNGSEVTPIIGNTEGTVKQFDNFYIFDIDGDNKKEVLAVVDRNNISIIEYNGSHFFNQSPLMGFSPSNVGGSSIACDGVDSCVVVYPAFNPTPRIAGAWFNSTHIKPGVGLLNDAVGMCFPHQTRLSVFDGQYTISAFALNDDKYRVIQFSINSSFQIDLESQIEFTGISGADCSDVNASFSSPLVVEIDSLEGGPEIVMAYKSDATTMKGIIFNDVGVEVQSFPSISGADSSKVGNCFLIDAFVDTGNVDVCCVSYDEDETEMELLCTSRATGQSPSTRIYRYDYTGNYNLSYLDINSEIVHSVNAKGSNPLDQVLTSYGIVEIFESECSLAIGLFDVCDNSDLIFSNGLGIETASISVDAQGTNQEDIILITNTTIHYLDDLFVDTQATFTGDIEINPCALSQPAKQNTTIQVTAGVVDLQSDSFGLGQNVNFTAILYADTEDNQTESRIASSGTTFTVSFIAYNNTADGILRLEARDDQPGNQDNPTVLDFSFQVANTGVEFGDGCVDSLVADEDENIIGSANVSGADIEDIADAIAPPSLIPPRFRPLWAVFIIILLGGLTIPGLMSMGQHEPTVLIYSSLAVAGITWLFFVFIGFISGWTVLIAILLTSAYLGFRFYERKIGAIN